MTTELLFFHGSSNESFINENCLQPVPGAARSKNILWPKFLSGTGRESFYGADFYWHRWKWLLILKNLIFKYNFYIILPSIISLNFSCILPTPQIHSFLFVNHNFMYIYTHMCMYMCFYVYKFINTACSDHLVMLRLTPWDWPVYHRACH